MLAVNVGKGRWKLSGRLEDTNICRCTGRWGKHMSCRSYRCILDLWWCVSRCHVLEVLGEGHNTHVEDAYCFECDCFGGLEVF